MSRLYITEAENPGLAIAADQLTRYARGAEVFEFGNMALQVYDDTTHITSFFVFTDSAEQAFVETRDHLRVLVELGDSEMILPNIHGYLAQEESEIISRFGFTVARTMLRKHPTLKRNLGYDQYEVAGELNVIKAKLSSSLDLDIIDIPPTEGQLSIELGGQD